MGIGNFGIFDNDGAQDYRDQIMQGLVTEIESIFADEQQFYWEMQGQGHLLPAVSLLATICQTYDHPFLFVKPAVVQAWRDRYCAAFNKVYWNEKREEYRSWYAWGRDMVIRETFARLLRYTEDIDDYLPKTPNE